MDKSKASWHLKTLGTLYRKVRNTPLERIFTVCKIVIQIVHTVKKQQSKSSLSQEQKDLFWQETCQEKSLDEGTVKNSLLNTTASRRFRPFEICRSWEISQLSIQNFDDCYKIRALICIWMPALFQKLFQNLRTEMIRVYGNNSNLDCYPTAIWANNG